ncbi:MAG: DMT family transporter [Bacteroidales bacterium]
MSDVKPRTILGHLMVLSTIIIYSFNTNFMKTLLPEWIDPFGLVVLRTGGSFVCFWLISFFIRDKVKATRKEILMMLLGGAIGMGLNMLFYIKGVAMTGPVDAFIIRTFQPTIVFGLSIIFLHKVFKVSQLGGIFIGLLGAIYVSLSTPLEGHQIDSFWGDVLIFLSSVAYAFFLVLIKPITSHINPFTVMKWMSLGAIIVTLPFGLKDAVEAPVFHQAFEWAVWGKLLFTVFVSTIVAYLLAVRALHYISAFADSLYIYLLPVLGTIVAICMKTDVFSWHDPIGLVMILCGFYIINKDSFKSFFSNKKTNLNN